MLNAITYTFISYHIIFLIICDAFVCVHCIVLYSSATEALINNNNNNNCASGCYSDKNQYDKLAVVMMHHMRITEILAYFLKVLVGGNLGHLSQRLPS